MNHYYEDIEGWFDFQDIYKEAIERVTKPATFVEVGTWLGRSLCFLGVEVINSNKPIHIYAVDNFSGSPEEKEITKQETPMEKYLKENSKDMTILRFLENIEPISEIVTPLLFDSYDAAQTFEDKSIDFCFIDSDHGLNSIKKEIDIWTPKIKIGGYIGGHDYHFWPVANAVQNKFDKVKIYEGKEIGQSWLYENLS